LTAVRTASCDVIVIGAGAAGMMCAARAGKRGRRVMLIDLPIIEKNPPPAAGANFTTFIPTRRTSCRRTHFAAPRRRYGPRGVVGGRHGITWHEKAGPAVLRRLGV
jgi:glycine/D-amino acid oxidase-like deaminating enzyme